MIVYTVMWKIDEELIKGKGRVPHGEYSFCFNVLCRSSKDAVACLEYLFPIKFSGSKFSLCDGVVSFKRMKVDSRGFEIQYLLMDGMKKPLYLRDCSEAIDCYNSNMYHRSIYRNKVV